MSEIKLSTATRKRLPRIIQGLLKGETYDTIAKAVGVKNRRTIERDVQAWRDSGGREAFLSDEWMHLHGKIRDMDPKEAYRQISKLLAKTLAQKIEGVLGGTPIQIKMWKPEDEPDE